MSSISRGSPLPLPTQLPLPQLPPPPAGLPVQRPVLPPAQDRGGRPSGQTGSTTGRQSGSADSSASHFRGTSTATASRSGRVSEDKSSTGLAADAFGVAGDLGRVGGRPAPSQEGERGEGFSQPAPDPQTGLTPADLRAVFAVPTHTAPEDLVRQLTREMDDLQENRGKRKMELMLEMTQAGREQNKGLMAIAEEAYRTMDEQFDELERLLLIRTREARQAVAARKVAMGASASYLIVAADAHHRRVLRLRLEKERANVLTTLLKATSNAASANAPAFSSFMQEWHKSIEEQIDVLGQYGLSASEQKTAEQVQALEARRSKEHVELGYVWREACEDAPELVGMLGEVRQRVEERYEESREALNS